MRPSLFTVATAAAVFVILLAACSSAGPTGTPGPTATPTPAPLIVESIPGSKNHGPDGTWWGYNQSKLTRIGDTVFIHVVENDDDPATESSFVIYSKTGDGSWVRGPAFPTSRPGNLVATPGGVLHAFVYDPVDVLENDSNGSIEHYAFPLATMGDLSVVDHDTVVPVDPDRGESANIRFSAAAGPDGTLAVAYGLTEGNGYDGHTEHLFTRAPAEDAWTHHIAGTQLGHDFYYSYALITTEGFSVLAIQDDGAPGGRNLYQIAQYFRFDGEAWSNEALLDHTGHADASQEDQLVEISENYQDADGTHHVLIDDRANRRWLHFERAGGVASWTQRVVERAGNEGINWMRLVDVGGATYAVAASWDRLFILTLDGSRWSELDVEGALGGRQDGIYLYATSPRTGAPQDSPYVDMLLLNGNADNYPDARNVYVRIRKAAFTELLG